MIKTILIVALMMGTALAFLPCLSDQDCIDRGDGNACMDGSCGYVQPAACQEQSDCPSSVPGYHYECEANLCMPSGGYLCNDDSDCMEANEGNECVGGMCMHSSRQPPGSFCPLVTAFITALSLLAISIKSD
jgi:hypothetical protein